jgi:hypothetical protein
MLFLLENSAGQKLFLQTHNLTFGENHFAFDVANLPAGVYFLRMKNDAGEMTKKLILQN